jgi:lipoprotein-anchoring transpeptidase ErfK/SrfK
VTVRARVGGAAAIVVAFALVACARQHPQAGVDAGQARAPAPAPSRDLAAEEAAEEAAHHRALVEAAHAAIDAGPWEGARLGATNFVTSVLSAPLWPEDAEGGQESVRLGYLRHGARVPVIPDPIVNDSCPDGWFELVMGGFVCGKNATLDPKNPRVRLAPHGPDLSKSLPYDYGVNIRNGTPLYRRVLSLEDRKKYEPWLVEAPRPAHVDPGAASTSDDDSDALDAGAVSAPHVEAPRAEAPDAAAVPWFLRDGGSKDVTLEELHGHGVLVRRMVRGFVLALDRDFKAAHAHWWRTTAGFAVPFERVVLHHPPPEFRGAWLTGFESAPEAGDAGASSDAGDAPDASDAGDASASASGVATSVAFVKTTTAHLLTIDPDKKKVAWGAAIEKRSVLALTDETYQANGTTYRRTNRGDGAWISMNDVQLATPSPPPTDLAPNEKWIDVDLTHQILVAFEGTRPVFATLVASGKRDLNDKTKDHPTPTGTFRIQAKHVSATMDGNIAADAPYSIEDVPWVMYFDGSYALHGAFWHSNFGHTMSHGCVNLSPADARELFGWTEPRLPDGWHGVFTRDPKDGTRVVLHE